MNALFEKFNSLNILIIGDVMIDAYVWGKVERISPEAPVPVVSITKKENRLGGAANVALNVQALGANAIICSAIGNDKEGGEFINILSAQKLATSGILQLEGRITTVKTRVIGHNQQIVRIDSENDENLTEQESSLLLDKITTIINNQKIDAIIFEDYDKGVITPFLIKSVVDLATAKGIITVVDPKKRNFLSYNNVSLFKPNLKELREGLKLEIDLAKDNELDIAVQILQDKLKASRVMVTLSEHGVYLSTKSTTQTIPAHIRNIADVSGAGDTVISTATVCLAAGLDEFKTAAIANLAGGLVCEHVGVVPINKAQLLEEVLKIY